MIKFEVYYDYEDPANLLYDSSSATNNGFMSGEVGIEVGKASEFTFSLSPDHPMKNSLKRYGPAIAVKESYISNGSVQDSIYLFLGRIISIDDDIYGNATYTCEGALNFLNDFRFSDVLSGTSIYLNDIDTSTFDTEKFIKRALDRYSQSMCNNENATSANYSQYGDSSINSRAFQFGEINGIGPAGFPCVVNRFKDTTGGVSAYEMLMDNAAKDCGGFFYLEHNKYPSSAASYLRNHYYTVVSFNCTSDYEFLGFPYDEDDPMGSLMDMHYKVMENYPTFTFGDNLLSYDRESSYDEVFSGVMPISSDGVTLSYNDSSRSTKGYNTSDYIWNADAISEYGRIVKKLEFDLTAKATIEGDEYEESEEYVPDSTLQSMRTNSEHWLASHVRLDISKYIIRGLEPIEYSDADGVERLRSKYLIRPMHGVILDDPYRDVYFWGPCLSMKINLFEPDKNEYTIGLYLPEKFTTDRISNS